jgi:hypothetical protein
MGWNIKHLDDLTTLKFSHACAMAVNDRLQSDWEGAECRETKDGQWVLGFFDDHMEHMDYVWDDEIQKILSEFKVTGGVYFMSAEGDNDGEYWGYEFVDGKCTRVHGEMTVVWKADEPKKKKKR